MLGDDHWQERISSHSGVKWYDNSRCYCSGVKGPFTFESADQWIQQSLLHLGVWIPLKALGRLLHISNEDLTIPQPALAIFTLPDLPGKEPFEVGITCELL